MSTPGIEAVTNELKRVAELAAGTASGSASAGREPPRADFSDVLKSALDEVNRAQKTSEELQKGYVLGNTDASITDVMISINKADTSFKFIVQARNKLTAVYEGILNNTQV